MPANQMTVKNSEINSASGTIRTQAGNFKDAYVEVFKQFTNIDNAWDGDDNAEFNTHVQSFRHDFEVMDEFFENLIAFLNDAKTRYEAAESDAKTRAGSLAK